MFLVVQVASLMQLPSLTLDKKSWSLNSASSQASPGKVLLKWEKWT